MTHLHIRILAYGTVRDLLAQDALALDLPPGTTVLDAVAQVAAAAGVSAQNLILSPDRQRIKVMVWLDDQIAAADALLHDGAELKLMHGQH
jgi:hypothetical protein